MRSRRRQLSEERTRGAPRNARGGAHPYSGGATGCPLAQLRLSASCSQGGPSRCSRDEGVIAPPSHEGSPRWCSHTISTGSDGFLLFRDAVAQNFFACGAPKKEGSTAPAARRPTPRGRTYGMAPNGRACGNGQSRDKKFLLHQSIDLDELSAHAKPRKSSHGGSIFGESVCKLAALGQVHQ